MSDLHFICSIKQIGFHRPLHHLRSRVAVRSELPASWMASWNGSPWGRCKSGQPLSWWGGARPSFSHEGPSSQLMCKPLYFEVLSQAFRGRGQNQLNSWGALLCFSGRWPGRLKKDVMNDLPEKTLGIPWLKAHMWYSALLHAGKLLSPLQSCNLTKDVSWPQWFARTFFLMG